MKKRNQWIIVSAFVGLIAFAAVELQNMKEARTALGLDAYVKNERLSQIKIAVIDNGFLGFEAERKLLPESAKLVLKYDPEFIKKFNLGDPEYNEGPAQTEHGRVMAQIIWGITGGNPEGPQFYLLNANGISNFKRAVRYAIEEKVDIILYSQNRECCGNFDGAGFYNDIVNQAVSAGILWVNAAGNYGGNVFNGSVPNLKELRLKSNLDENPGQIILMWNSSGPEETTGTDKDLDLFVYDEDGKEVAKSELKQVLKKESLGEGETFLPRERLKFNFSKNKSGTYTIRIKAKGNNFTQKDQVRLVVIPERQPIFDKNSNRMVRALELLDATPGGEIMVPADNPGVITVGDLSPESANGPTSDGRMKPEILLENSEASFTNGQSSSGTSNAAAYFAGVLAVLKSHRPDLTRDAIINLPKKRLSTLSEPIENVAFSEFATMQEKILNTVEDLSHESAVLAGHYKDGRYVLGIRQSPKEVLTSLCGEIKDEAVEVYLALSTRPGGMECFTRSLMASNEKPLYPWEKDNSEKRAYIEVRQVFPTLQAPNQQGIWLTPTPDQLLQH